MSGQTLAEMRVYRTVDGELVRENDPRGAYLAYGVGDPVNEKEAGSYQELVDGKRSGHEVPGLMHSATMTQVADAARVLAHAEPGSVAAEVAQDTLEKIAEVVDAARMPAPAVPAANSPTEIIRQVAASKDDDRPVTDVPLYRTEDGRLVGDGDMDATTQAYAKGDRVEKDDEDAFKEVSAKSAARRNATKAAVKPADKAAVKPADK